MPLARGLSLVGLAAVLTTSLAACSGTPLGERLSGSFGTPATPAAAGTASGSSGAGPVGGPAAATSPSTALPAPSPPAAAAPASGAAKPDGAVASRPVKPTAGSAAYRITIKLPGADPSAPAEAVTEALRAAGVSFEVETIERMPADGGRSAAAAGTSPAAPDSSPAPAPR